MEAKPDTEAYPPVRCKSAPNRQVETLPPASAVPECPICFSPYDRSFRTPLMLPPCGHTFCLHCLSQMSLFPTLPQGFYCPLCRAPVPLPPGGAPCLPPNAELLSRLPPGPLRRVWLEGPVLCYWTEQDGGGAGGGVARLPLTGTPGPGGVMAGGVEAGEAQPAAMVSVLSQRRLRTAWCLGMLSFILSIILFIAVFLPIYFQN